VSCLLQRSIELLGADIGNLGHVLALQLACRECRALLVLRAARFLHYSNLIAVSQ
jgi:hypothetical protein